MTMASVMKTRTWRSMLEVVASLSPFGRPTRSRWALRLALAAALCLALVSRSHAAEYGRAVTVGAQLTMAGTRPAYPNHTNLMLVYVNPAPWGSSSCRQDAVAIKKTDTHLLAHFLTALQSGDPIAFYVDDTLRPTGDDLCQVTLIQVGALASS